MCLCVCTPHFFSTQPSECNQIWHAYADWSGNHSNHNNLTHPSGVPEGILGGHKFNRERGRRDGGNPGNQLVLHKGACRHATISWGESVFLKRKSVSIRIIHQCLDVSRHFVFAGDSHRDAVCKKIQILRNKIKITISLLSLIHCNITLVFPFVCTICNAISYAT